MYSNGAYVLCSFPLFAKAIALSTIPEPSLPAERGRIENAGRQVTLSEARGNIFYIDDGIVISRSIGMVLPEFLVCCSLVDKQSIVL